MARSWLEVTTDEVQSKRGAEQRLAERRATVARRARALAAETVAPLFARAATQRGWRYREAQDSEWSVVRCEIYAPSETEGDPTAAFCSAEFDAYQPLVVLRHKAEGAAARPRSRTLPLDALDAAAVAACLDG